MRFSIVIPLYNKEKYIKRALQSVLNQTFNDYEIIVVNDGSTDRSKEVVKNIKNPSIVIFDQQNQGVSAARNRGIDESKGKYIAFLDADDNWEPDFLQTINQLQKKYPDAGIYTTSYKLVKGHNEYLNVIMKCKNSLEGQENFFILNEKIGGLHTSSIVVKKKIFSQAGGFSVGHKRQEDLDMWFRIGLHYEVAFSSKVCSNYYYTISDSAVHTCKPPLNSPLLSSIKLVNSDKSIDDRTRKLALAYVEKIEARNVEDYILLGDKNNSKMMLIRYYQSFGFSPSYFRLIFLMHLPRKILLLKKSIRLFAVSKILSLRSCLIDKFNKK
jgi:glycosyltransferase involved in cell wall biosynthesis